MTNLSLVVCETQKICFVYISFVVLWYSMCKYSFDVVLRVFTKCQTLLRFYERLNFLASCILYTSKGSPSSQNSGFVHNRLCLF